MNVNSLSSLLPSSGYTLNVSKENNLLRICFQHATAPLPECILRLNDRLITCIKTPSIPLKIVNANSFDNELIPIDEACKIKGEIPFSQINFDGLENANSIALHFLELAIYATPDLFDEEFEHSLNQQLVEHKEWLSSLDAPAMKEFGKLCCQYVKLQWKRLNISTICQLINSSVTTLPSPIAIEESTFLLWTDEAILFASMIPTQQKKNLELYVKQTNAAVVTKDLIENILALGEDHPRLMMAELPKERAFVILTGGRIDYKWLHTQFPRLEATEKTQQIAQKYLVRVPNWGAGYGNQFIYGLEMHRSIQMGAKLLNDPNLSMDDFIHFATLQRALLANENEWYGRARNCAHYTPSGERYGEITRRMARGDLNDIPLDSNEGWEEKVPSDFQVESRTLYCTINQENLPLSRLVLIRGDASVNLDSFPGIFIATTGIHDARAALFHEFPFDKIPKAMELVKEKMKLALDPLTPQEDAHHLLGEIYWWICQIKPWKAGDPSIAEILIRSIATYRGIELGAWKEGIISWIEVISKPTPSAFAKKFKEFFEKID